MRNCVRLTVRHDTLVQTQDAFEFEYKRILWNVRFLGFFY